MSDLVTTAIIFPYWSTNGTAEHLSTEKKRRISIKGVFKVQHETGLLMDGSFKRPKKIFVKRAFSSYEPV